MIKDIKIGDYFKDKKNNLQIYKIVSEKRVRQLNNTWVDNIIENNKNLLDTSEIVWLEEFNNKNFKTGWLWNKKIAIEWLNKCYKSVNYFNQINYKFLND